MHRAQVMVDAHDHTPELGMRSLCRIDVDRNQIRIDARKLTTGVGHTPMVRSDAAIGRKAVGVDACRAPDQRSSAGVYRSAIMRSYPPHSHLPGPANHRQNQRPAITATRSDAAGAMMAPLAGRRAGIDLVYLDILIHNRWGDGPCHHLTQAVQQEPGCFLLDAQHASEGAGRDAPC